MTMRRKTQRGFSLMEITVVMAIVSVVMIMVYSLIEETMRITLFNESHNDLAIITQSAVNTIQSAVQQSRIAFEEDTLGTSYRAALSSVPSDVTVWGDSRLPVFAAAGEIQPDAALEEFTGNSLLLARQLPPLTITYDHDGNNGTPEVEFLADRYRFEYYFLARSAVKPFGGSTMTMDLLVSRSGEYVDFFQLDSLDDPSTARVVQRLMVAGLSRAWNPGAPVNSAFYTLAGAADGTFNLPINNATIPIVHTTTLLRPFFGVHDQQQRLAGGMGISGRIDYSIAFGTFPLLTPVRVFAQPDAGNPGFPSGFEVKVAGPARNRKVMTRVVMMAHYGAKKHYDSQQGFVITAARF
jgi:prepilin-type N-terminal cleavage/methylation domain-containing protein